MMATAAPLSLRRYAIPYCAHQSVCRERTLYGPIIIFL